MCSGAGVLTRALLHLPPSRLKKLIVLEDEPKYVEVLKECPTPSSPARAALTFTQALEAHDDRLQVVPRSAYSWDTYAHLASSGVLDDVEVSPWEEECKFSSWFSSFANSHFPLAWPASTSPICCASPSPRDRRAARFSVAARRARPPVAFQVRTHQHEFHHSGVTVGGQRELTVSDSTLANGV